MRWLKSEKSNDKANLSTEKVLPAEPALSVLEAEPKALTFQELKKAEAKARYEKQRQHIQDLAHQAAKHLEDGTILDAEACAALIGEMYAKRITWYPVELLLQQPNVSAEDILRIVRRAGFISKNLLGGVFNHQNASFDAKLVAIWKAAYYGPSTINSYKKNVEDGTLNIGFSVQDLDLLYHIGKAWGAGPALEYTQLAKSALNASARSKEIFFTLVEDGNLEALATDRARSEIRKLFKLSKIL